MENSSSLKLKKKLQKLLIVEISGIISLPIILYLYFSGYYQVISTWWQLQRIPNVQVISIKSTISDSVTATIQVRDKGEITFAGWGLTDEQFKSNSQKYIEISKIGNCEVEVIQGPSYRKWIILNEEMKMDIKTISETILNYDVILDKVRKLPKLNNNRQPGYYSVCK